jgi:carbon-monoxide dehydrogenase iron sulfur subunit
MRKVYCDMRKCLSCRSCEMACAVRHSRSGDLYRALREEPAPRRLARVLSSELGPFPLRCHHCEVAACIDACKTGATHRDPATGKVLIDPDKCVGCWMCVMVCPFGAVFPDAETQKALKCDLCESHDRPACVDSCPTGALFFEEYEEFEEAYKRRRPRLPVLR